jgi:peptidyl-prolyl cis-trans isomerase-like 3
VRPCGRAVVRRTRGGPIDPASHSSHSGYEVVFIGVSIDPQMSVTICTNHGGLKVELCVDDSPRACENFLKLSASNYYDGTKFHRNIAAFMIQGGDPSGSGKGGESIWGGTFDDELKQNLRHDCRGVVSMANNGANTNGSQFFITYSGAPHLDNVYTIFGHVVQGFDTLDKLEVLPVKGKKHRPVDDIVIEKVIIHANPFAE